MGTIKLFFGIFVIVAAIYMGIEVIPPYYSNYEQKHSPAPTPQKLKIIFAIQFSRWRKITSFHSPERALRFNALGHRVRVRSALKRLMSFI